MEEIAGPIMDPMPFDARNLPLTYSRSFLSEYRRSRCCSPIFIADADAPKMIVEKVESQIKTDPVQN